jgi:hypothetical protein
MLEIIFAGISEFVSYFFIQIFIGIMILLPGNFIANLFIRKPTQDKLKQLKQRESRSYRAISVCCGLSFWAGIAWTIYRLSQ